MSVTGLYKLGCIENVLYICYFKDATFIKSTISTAGYFLKSRNNLV